MSSHVQPEDVPQGTKEREERLAHLSGAMAIARLAHQVKQLELQTYQQDALVEPSFTPICSVMCRLFIPF